MSHSGMEGKEWNWTERATASARVAGARLAKLSITTIGKADTYLRLITSTIKGVSKSRLISLLYVAGL
jgi:hypothetical protein